MSILRLVKFNAEVRPLDGIHIKTGQAAQILMRREDSRYESEQS
jgi:hypothetical protein